MAAAALGWLPDDFWKSTPHEFFTAVEGWKRFHTPSDDDED